jgi:hypothetical protein
VPFRPFHAAFPEPGAPRPNRRVRQKAAGDTDREIRASFDRQASGTKQGLLSWSLPILMRNAVSSFFSFR